ncbi:hypothetical protein [Streptomyces hawaiiensis]|uniref:hypothetical protein n=1 Tax=Streptomyces hawaiiensis TaxID=67305 RepID=UPI00365DEB8E
MPTRTPFAGTWRKLGSSRPLHDSPPHGPSEEGAHLPQELNDVYEEIVPGTFFDVTRAVVLVTDASQLALWGTLFRSEEEGWTVVMTLV